MKTKVVGYVTFLLLSATAMADVIGRSTVQAESPFTSYTAGVVAYVLLVGFLVAALLVGGILIVNLGLMSKRAEDRIGRRTPSDVGILKSNTWPPERDEHRMLPAEEDENAAVASTDTSDTTAAPTAPRFEEERERRKIA